MAYNDYLYNGESNPPAENNGQPGSGPPPDFTDEDTQDPYNPNERVDGQYGYQTGINGEKNYDINVGMTGGLMDTINAINTSKYGNSNYNIRGGRANTRNVKDEELSQFQLEKMLASNSPLMRQAAAQGMARGGSRGLMNSSMSTGAAQGSMIAGAQPFALQDSSWYGQTASENMGALNDMERANLESRGLSMQARAARDRQILQEQLSGYGDIRKAMIGIEDREDTQEYGTEERMGTQGYNAWQNELNRDWTSNENMLTNSLSWAQSQLDSATKYGVTREQAFADMYSSIMNNPNPKFKADQRQQAVRNLQATMDDYYQDSPTEGSFEGSFNPATGEFTQDAPDAETESQRADDGSLPPLGWPEGWDWKGYAAYAGSAGGDAGVDANFDVQKWWLSNPYNQQWGSQQSPDVGAESAQLPGVT